MRLLVISVLVILLSSCTKEKDGTQPETNFADTTQKAFPTAEGFGAYSQGGRGGEVIYVTNLNDSGPGSFRHAVTRSGKRTVVFAVSGIIELNSLLIIENPYLTIAGQVAPENGITLKNSGLYIRTHDIIIRHLRIRPGDSDSGHSFEDRDAITVGENAYNIIIDHVSASWAVDEIISTFYEPYNISFQWCILSEGLSHSKHPEGEHSKALLVGDNTKKVSIHHNIFAHNNDRCPVQVKGGSTCDVVNNIVYNWGEYALSFAIDYVESGVEVNVMSNMFLKGPSTTGDFFSEPENPLNSKLYLENNTGDDALLMDFNANRQSYINSKSYLVDSRINWTGNVAVQQTQTIKDNIIAGAGATLPLRDEIDRRIVLDIQNATGAIIDSPADVGGYPNSTPIVWTELELLSYDSDRDGMPNYWEEANSLNSNNPEDRNLDSNGDGYTNLEEFLNQHTP